VTRQRLNLRGATQYVHEWTADDRDTFKATVVFELVTETDGKYETTELSARTEKALDDDAPTIEWPPVSAEGQPYAAQRAHQLAGWVTDYYQRIAPLSRRYDTHTSRDIWLPLPVETDWAELPD